MGLALGVSVLLYFSLTQRGGELPVQTGESTTGSTDWTDAGPGFSPSQVISDQRGNAIVEATRRVSPAVVSINSIRSGATTRVMPLLDLYTRSPPQNVGVGSGFIVDDRGYILTNEHVIREGDQVVVTLNNGEHYAADILGRSAKFDLAVLKIRGEEIHGLPVVELGDSDDVLVGEWAIAIGSPFGYLLDDSSPTVTVGVISAVGRDLKMNQPLYLDMIQTDAAINQGNSGGPLVNSLGQVVGINAFILSETGGSVGVSFAIPANRGRWVLEEILKYGRIREFYAGMTGAFLSPYQRQDLPDDVPDGWAVSNVVTGSPAHEAGIRTGDILRVINGEPIVNNRALVRRLYEARVGAVLEFVVWRHGKGEFPARLTLVESPTGPRLQP